MTHSLSPVVRRQTIADALHRTAVRLPTKTAIVCGDTQWTYAGFDAIVSRLAAGLNQIGVCEGDKVAVLARNSHGFAALRFALARRGAVLVPINFMLKAEEVAFILRHAGAKTLATDSGLAGLAREASALETQVQQFIWLPSEDPGEPAPGMHRFDELAACTDTLPDVALGSFDLAQIVYTSGTESSPKGAMLTHDAVLWQYVSCVINAEIAETDRTLHALPLYHCAQLDVFFGPAIYIGSSNVITSKPTPDNLLALIEQHQITSFFAPPTVWIALLRSPLFDASKLGSLAKGYYGASIMPVEVLKELAARLPAVRLWNLYGQTEIAPLATMLGPDDQLRKPGSCGKAVLNVETRVVNDDMQDVAVGEVGEIVHRSPHLMLGYFNDPERTAASFVGDWFHSGDLAVIDDEGFITVVDRKKDMIISGGLNVYPTEIENIIYQHSGVEQCAVIGVGDDYWVEVPCAIVIRKPRAAFDEAELIEFVRDRLAHFKAPKSVVFVDDLPVSAAGKVLKRELRQRYRDPQTPS